MKRIKLLFILFSIYGCIYAQTWISKTNFGGTVRYGAVGFSIGTKGYIGTGSRTGFSFFKDFWEWDQTNNTWTQKADFGGTPRIYPVGFSIGSKGYIGTGWDGGVTQDFWEWDGDISSPTYNTWTKKASFAGTARFFAVGFSVGSKGYIGTGFNGAINTRDFWEYDTAMNIWTKKADFGGTARYCATGFSVGDKGYIGTGWGNVAINTKDFWEWNQATDVWTKKADFGGSARAEATSFVIGNYGYVGTGTNFGVAFAVSDFWKYNPVTDAWTSIPNFGGGIREMTAGFSIGCYGYVATGFINDNNTTSENDLWEYFDPSDTTCGCNINASVSGTNIICAGQNATLTALGGTSYLWSTNQTDATIAPSPTANTTYTALVTSGSCTAAATATVIVNPKPIANAASSATITQGQTATLTASGGGTYSWSSGQTSTSITVTPLVTTIYCVTITDLPAQAGANGCTDTICVTVTVISEPIECSNAGELYLPTVFSPNDDGENDILQIYYGNIPCIKTFKLVIYNRWGEEVFQTIKPIAEWDGYYRGQIESTAVFAFYMEATLISGEKITKKGNISLVR